MILSKEGYIHSLSTVSSEHENPILGDFNTIIGGFVVGGVDVCRLHILE